jgi:hypothetical protein
VLDNVAIAGLVEFESELVACAASCFDEDAEGEVLVVDLSVMLIAISSLLS